VFGASGSGKSSLLRAGLQPVLEDTTILLTPGRRPVEELAARIANLLGRERGADRT
jgi:predicted AAA+ superfamily ATPase